MKESYEKGLASRLSPDPYANDGNGVGVALVRGTRRPAIEFRPVAIKGLIFACRPCKNVGKATRTIASRRVMVRRGGIIDPVHV